MKKDAEATKQMSRKSKNLAYKFENDISLD